MPPKMQLSHMPVSGVTPASGLRLSCMQLTEPFEVLVVSAAQVAPAEVPKRSSFPSRLPSSWSTGKPGTCGAAGLSAPFFSGSHSTSSAARPGTATTQ